MDVRSKSAASGFGVLSQNTFVNWSKSPGLSGLDGELSWLPAIAKMGAG